MAEKSKTEHTKEAAPTDAPIVPLTCGVVMPISALDDCTEAHWADVYQIISDAIGDAGFRANIVSNADEAGIIQKKIIQNLFDNPIVICDVSGKNPNVMFELGMRLAFDKPTIVIKDDRTDYSFDTSPIEHIPYPRDLRFNKVIDFKKKLSEKIVATVSASQNDEGYTTFLKHFGEFKVASLEQKEVTPQEFLMEEMSEIKRYLRRIDMDIRFGARRERPFDRSDSGICLKGHDGDDVERARKIAAMHPAIKAVQLRPVGDHVHLDFVLDEGASEPGRNVRSAIRSAITHGVRRDEG